MQRKVIQQGPSTLMVSLPSKWVKENNIKKGQELNVDLINNQLVIYNKAVQLERKMNLTVKTKEDYLDRSVMGPYREGYNEIYIKYEDPGVVEKVRETLHFLLGFEIVDQTSNSCTIKNISEGSEEDYPTMFRRMFQILLTMTEACLEYARTRDENRLKTAIDLRETLVKLEQFNLRLINQQNSFSLQQKSLEFFYVWNIGTFGKVWSSLAREQLSKKPTLSKEDIEFLVEAVKYTREFYTLFYNRERAGILAMKQKLYAQLRPNGAALLDKSKNRMIIFYLLRVVNSLYEVSLTF